MRKNKALGYLALLPFCFLINFNCSLKLFEYPHPPAVEEKTYGPEKQEVLKAMQSRPEPKLEEKLVKSLDEKGEEEPRLVRYDLEDFVDEEWGGGWRHIKNRTDINTFASNEKGLDGLLVSADKLVDYHTGLPVNPSPDVRMSFIHLSDAQLHDERVYMFDKELTTFFDKFVESFEHKPGMVLYDHSYYLTLVATINLLCERLPEEQKPRFMMHTGDAIDMGVVSELYEFVYVTNKLPIAWFNVLGNHDYPVYGNIKSQNVGVINPNMGFQTVNSRYNFIHMHGRGFDVKPHLVYFSPSNAPHKETGQWDSVYNGFDLQGKRFEYSAKLERLPEGIQFPVWIERRISYDSAKKTLILKDFSMASTKRDELLRLSDEPSYQKAINELYSKSIFTREYEPCSNCPGYYYFEALPPKDGRPGILCIVLDTTTSNFKFAKGTLYQDEEVEAQANVQNPEPEQITWLRGKLDDYSKKGNWMVLAFGHHQLGPEGFLDDSYIKLMELFWKPEYNVIAYFCGHTHEHDINPHHDPDNPNKFFWEIITDSIFEYPKRGSLVSIRHAEDKKWEIALQSFWPYFLEKPGDGAPVLLQNAKKCLDASREDSEGKKRAKRFDKLEQKHHDVVLKFIYPK